MVYSINMKIPAKYKKEFSELRDLLNYLCDNYGLARTIELSFSKGWTSYADIRYKYDKNGNRITTYRIIICEPVFRRSIEYSWAILIHEFVHHLLGFEVHHGEQFKNRESAILKDFGMIPVGYARAYYRELKTISGQTIYRR